MEERVMKKIKMLILLVVSLFALGALADNCRVTIPHELLEGNSDGEASVCLLKNKDFSE